MHAETAFRWLFRNSVTGTHFNAFSNRFSENLLLLNTSETKRLRAAVVRTSSWGTSWELSIGKWSKSGSGDSLRKSPDFHGTPMFREVSTEAADWIRKYADREKGPVTKFEGQYFRLLLSTRSIFCLSIALRALFKMVFLELVPRFFRKKGYPGFDGLFHGAAASKWGSVTEKQNSHLGDEIFSGHYEQFVFLNRPPGAKISSILKSATGFLQRARSLISHSGKWIDTKSSPTGPKGFRRAHSSFSLRTWIFWLLSGRESVRVFTSAMSRPWWSNYRKSIKFQNLCQDVWYPLLGVFFLFCSRLFLFCFSRPFSRSVVLLRLPMQRIFSVRNSSL